MELEKLYNEETIRAVKEFICDFQVIFPGLLTEDELISRIIKNMHHNIDFNADLDEMHMGEYTNHKVFIGKNIKEKGQVLFHEMIHVITDGYFIINFEYRNFIEGLTTLAEELYVKYKGIKMPKFRRNVNGYVPTFVRELNFVKDGNLLRQFIKNPDEVYKVFFPKLLKYNLPFGHDDKDYQREMNEFARRNETITLMAKQKESDQEMRPLIKVVEETILEQYVTSICIGYEKFNSKKFLELYEMQMYPNIVRYVGVLNELLRDGKINKIDITNCGKLGVIYTLCNSSNIDVDISEFNENELEWLASEVFGFSNYIYDSQELISDDTDIDKLFDERDYYLEVMPIYKQLIEEVINGELDLDIIKDCRLRRSKVVDKSYSAHEYLLNAEKRADERLLDIIFGVEENRIGIYCLEDDKGIQVIKSGEFFYYPTDSVSFMTQVMVSNSDYSEAIYNYLEKYSNCGVMYVDRVVDYDLDDFGNCDVNLFVLRGSDLLKVKLTLDKGKIVEEVNIVTFMEDGKSIFEKDTKEKLRIKE